MVVRFGPFELDSDREELRKSGLVLRLPHQPARLLQLFVRRAGDVITREEIQQELWGSETHVDFEQGINAAIRQIRFHLGDNAEAPRYLKTIPRRGYVFIAPVEGEAEAVPRGSSGSSGSSEEEGEKEPTPPPSPRNPEEPEEPRNQQHSRPFLAFTALLTLIAIAAAAYFLVPRNRRTIAVVPFRAIGVLPAGVDPRAFTQELRATLGMLPRKHLMLLEERSNDRAQVRLEGTIQRERDSIRVIVSGIDARSRTQLWSETYERRIGEHQNQAMQTAHMVAHEVVRRFLPPPRHEPLLRTSVKPATADLYRRARVERRRSLPDPNGNRAAAMFEEALRDEPNFAEALSGLADVWAQRAANSLPPERDKAVVKARQYADRALALQPDIAEAITAKGLMAFQYDWDLGAAEELFRQAVESDPEYVDAHYNLCATLAARGEVDAAIEEYEAARALDPADFDLHPAEGMLYLRSRRYEEAVAKYREILRFRDSVVSRWGILWASIKLRNWNDADAILRVLLELPPRPAGKPATYEEFRELFRRLEPVVRTAVQRRTFDDYHLAAYYSERGDRDLAFAALNRAFAYHSPAIGNLMVDPRFDALRNDPRFTPLAKRIR